MTRRNVGGDSPVGTGPPVLVVLTGDQLGTPDERGEGGRDSGEEELHTTV